MTSQSESRFQASLPKDRAGLLVARENLVSIGRAMEAGSEAERRIDTAIETVDNLLKEAT